MRSLTLLLVQAALLLGSLSASSLIAAQIAVQTAAQTSPVVSISASAPVATVAPSVSKPGLSIKSSSIATKPQASSSASAKPAAPAQRGADWASLKPNQQLALKPLESEWPRLDDGRKRKWLDVADSYNRANLTEKQRMHDRMTAWTRLTPEQRRKARTNFQASRQLDADAKAEKWRQYQALSPEQRKALAKQAPDSKSVAAPLATAAPAAKLSSATAAVSSPKASNVAKVKLPAGATNISKTDSSKTPRIQASPGMIDPNTLLPTAKPMASASAPASAN